MTSCHHDSHDDCDHHDHCIIMNIMISVTNITLMSLTSNKPHTLLLLLSPSQDCPRARESCAPASVHHIHDHGHEHHHDNHHHRHHHHNHHEKIKGNKTEDLFDIFIVVEKVCKHN